MKGGECPLKHRSIDIMIVRHRCGRGGYRLFGYHHGSRDRPRLSRMQLREPQLRFGVMTVVPERHEFGRKRDKTSTLYRRPSCVTIAAVASSEGAGTQIGGRLRFA